MGTELAAQVRTERAAQVWSALDNLQIAINNEKEFNKDGFIKDLVKEESERRYEELTLMEAYTRLISTLVKIDVRPKVCRSPYFDPVDYLWPYIDIVINYILY